MNRDLLAMQVMEAAIDLSGEERSSYVDDACKGDSKLLKKVRSLLRAAAEETEFLATRSESASESAPSRVPNRIGSYKIIREIGRGGMGIVYEAEHDAMQRCVALKILSLGGLPSDDQLTRFHREARAAGKLHHTNIVPVFEVGSADGLHYYAMQYIDGDNLDSVINEIRNVRSQSNGLTVGIVPTVAHRSLSETAGNAVAGEADAKLDTQDSEQPTSSWSSPLVSSESTLGSPASIPRAVEIDGFFQRVAEIGQQAANALQYAHVNGTLHRDIKPANLIIDTKGTVWMLDFGLAKAGEHSLTSPGDIVGTIRYMAPERFYGNADERSDIYSLGLTLYELATLRPAFGANDRATLIHQVTTEEARPPRLVDDRIPKDFDTIIMKSLERNPNRRYDSAAELAEDLGRFISDQPIQARRVSPAERMWRVCRRNPVVSGLAGALLAMLALVVIGSSRFAFISNSQKNEALELERSTRQRRYELNYQSARAVRKTDQLGRRFDALASIREAVELLPTLDLSEDQIEEERAKLRTEATAALGQFDLQAEETWTARSSIERGIAFNSDHTLYAQPFESGEIHLLERDKFERNKKRLKAILKSPHGKAWHLRFSEDGNYLLSLNQASRSVVSVWALAEIMAGSPANRKINTINEVDHAVVELNEPFIEVVSHWRGNGVFSADGSTVAISTEDSVVVLDLPSGVPRMTLQTGYAPKSIQLSSDGTRLLTAELRATEIHVWDTVSKTETPDQTISLPEGSSGAYSLIWASDRNILVAGLADGNLLVWEDGFELQPQQFAVHKHTIVRVHLHPQRSWLFTQGWDETVRVFDLVTKRQLSRLERHALLDSGVSSDGTQIGLSCVERENVGVWKISEPCLNRFAVDQTNLEATSVYRIAALHPKHPRLMVTAHDQGIFFYDIENRTELTKLTGYGNATPVFAKDGENLFIFSESGADQFPMRIIQTEGHMELGLGEPEHIVGPIPGADMFGLSADESQLLALLDPNSGKARVELISLESPTDGVSGTPAIPERRQIGPHSGMSGADISPDGKWVVTSSWKNAGVKVWQASDGQEVITLLPDTTGTNSKFSSDGQYLVTAQRGEIFVWEVGTWKPVEFDATRRLGIMGDMAFTEQLLVGDHTRFVPQLIDTRSQHWLMRLETSLEDTQRSYAFSADGSKLVIAGTEYTHLWDLKQIQERLTELGLGW